MPLYYENEKWKNRKIEDGVNFEMRIRWENMFGLLLLMFGIYVFVKIKPYLDRVFEDLADGCYDHYDPMHKVIVLGLICLVIVAIAKVIANR